MRKFEMSTSRPKEEIAGAALAVVVVFMIYIYFLHLRRRWNSKGCLDPKKFMEFKLMKITQITHNTARFRFALLTPESSLGLPIGQHIVCRGNDGEGKEVIRPYTPITLDSDKGYFELVVKMYAKGRMSHHFRQMRIGDYLSIQGPKGRFKYNPGQVRAFGMIAGGTGITPIFQVTRAILENKKDRTRVHLIYANYSIDDILLKDELDAFAKNFPQRFKVYYVLSKPPEQWDGGEGHVNIEMIHRHCPPPDLDIQILRCGPPEMNKAMATHLNALGYTSHVLFEF